MPRTEKQNQKIRDKRRQKIITSSLKLFALNGYKPVSIDDIAKETGCTHSLIYHYFSSKEELYHEVIQLVRTKIFDDLVFSSYAEHDSPATIVENVLNSVISGLKSKQGKLIACSLSLILNVTFNEDEIKLLNLNPDKYPGSLLDSIIERGQKLGEFREGDPKEYTVTILGFLTGICLSIIKINRKEVICPDADILMRILRKENK